MRGRIRRHVPVRRLRGSLNRFHDALQPKIHENWREAARGRTLRNGRREEIKGLQQDHRRLRGTGEVKRDGKGIYAVKEKCRRHGERVRSDEGGKAVFRC